MSKGDARAFIRARYTATNQDLNDEFETVTVRLEAKDALMLSAMSKVFNFPVSSSFTDIVSKHLVDLLLSLKDEDFKATTDPFNGSGSDRYPTLGKLRDMGVLSSPSFKFRFGIPDGEDEQ